MKYSIKQLLRTPRKTCFFFLMLAFGTSLFVIGLNLWIQTSKSLQRIDETFTTIGAVTQKEDGMSVEEQWDAALNDNIYIEKPIYSQLLSVDLLKKLDLDYVSEPEQRRYRGENQMPFCGA